MNPQQFTISLFETVGDTRPAPKLCTWAGFCMSLTRPKVRADKDGQLFSPARYKGNRRLQSNVIDLSMLVLEIDGAWRCQCCGHAGPHVMFVNNRIKDEAGHVDRSPRCPACLKAKCAKCYKSKPRPHTETTIEPIKFTFKSVIEGMRLAFPGNAFAVYSTHSHMRVTEVVCGRDGLCGGSTCSIGRPCGAVFGHEVPEPCYRLIVPLQSPVPFAEYAALWHRAVAALHESEVIADPQAKDPNRIFYTPVKASDDSLYEYHVEPGRLFDWSMESVPGAVATGSPSSTAGDEPLHPTAASRPVATAPCSDFITHEDLNKALCRLIAARGKVNSRGHIDAKCLSHNGRGNTSLVMIPDTGAVFCNAGCDYFSIVRSEGLPELHLPTRAQLAVNEARSANSPAVIKIISTKLTRERPLTIAQLHTIYALLLAHFFELSAEHEAQIRSAWRRDPFCRDEALAAVQWYGAEDRPARPVKVCSMPNSVQVARAVAQLVEWGFDLREVPGFFVEVQTQRPHAPSSASAREQWQSQNFGQWRMNLTSPKGLLVPCFDERGWLNAVQIYRSVNDRNYTLLTSRGLPGGGKALFMKERVA